MLLENRIAVVYGGGGHIGGAMARAFAREGARVVLAGRTPERIDAVADAIRAAGGTVETAVVDALDEAAVDVFVDGVVARHGRIDVTANVIGIGDVQKPLLEITTEEFMQPVMNAVRTQFLTIRAAGRHMVAGGGGVVLLFGGGGPPTEPGLGGFQVALDAMESIRRLCATEWGKHGVRVVTLLTGGILEAIAPDFPGRQEISDAIEGQTLLGRAATLDDVGNVAAFVVSDRARTLTGAVVNITSGAVLD